MNKTFYSVFTILICLQGTAYAQDLNEIYNLSLQSDPQLKAAEAAFHASETARPQARALLLPNANFSADTSDNSQENKITSTTNDYNSNGYTLSITQPVFRYNYWIQLDQADSTIGQANAEYGAAQQDLIIRVAERYFAVLASLDNLEFARSEKTAIARQLEQAQKRFDVGLIAITDVHEAQAAYDLSVANEIQAENQVANSHEALSEITGQIHNELASLVDKIPLLAPDPASTEEWTKVALEQNLQLQALKYAAEAAKKNIKLQKSGHYPTLDLVASRTKSDVGGGSFGSRETDTDSISLQFNVPIYQGGLTTSKTQEAVHLHTQARENVEQQRRATLRQARDAYRGVLTGISRVKALKQAMVSSESALETTEAGFEVGTRTIVDVLVAQRELFRARRDYAQTRYDYILDTLRLKQAAGTLAPDDLQRINGWLK
jgi:outer membrane protein